MMNNFKALLAIGIDSLEPVTEAVEQAAGKDYTLWIIIAAVIAVAAAVTLFILWFKPLKKLHEARIEKRNKKVKKQRDAELERLHEIKRKNKRK